MRAFEVVGSALLIVALGIAAQAQDKPSPEPEETYGSPKAVFDAMNKAANKKDFKTVMKCLTPESRDRMTAQLAGVGASLRIVANLGDDAKLKDRIAEFDKTLAKHGVTNAALTKFDSATTSEERDKAAKALAAPVKDKAALMGDLMVVLEKFSPGKVDRPESELKEVKITGRKAEGKVVLKLNGMEMSQPIEFVKAGGGWLVIVADTKSLAAKAPPRDPFKK